MAYIKNKKADSATSLSLEFFKRYQESFGSTVRAEMVKKPGFVFTLENSKGDKMVFDGSFSSGYHGEGPKGTQEVLKLCGFDIDDEYAETHGEFVLLKNK